MVACIYFSLCACRLHACVGLLMGINRPEPAPIPTSKYMPAVVNPPHPVNLPTRPEPPC